MTAPFGEKLKAWRRVRRLSQLQLAVDAEVSPRHLSFIETGRSQPSREMVVKLAQNLALPPREQNALLLAAGFAPSFPQTPLEAPKLEVIRKAAALVLGNHEPFPAVAIDRTRNIVMANRAAATLQEGVAPELLAGSVNLYRLLLDPRGLAPRIVDFAQYRHHLLARLQRDAEQLADPDLHALHTELEKASRKLAGTTPIAATEDAALTFRLRHGTGVLSFIATLATFGTPFDLTVAELTIESLFPLDAFTHAQMHALAKQR